MLGQGKPSMEGHPKSEGIPCNSLYLPRIDLKAPGVQGLFDFGQMRLYNPTAISENLLDHRQFNSGC
ncbi:hypothetical protein Trydic_g12613 [Trypoxylus dichotomus]